MKQPLTIAITGDKGGVGKTTIAILLAEWLLVQDFPCQLIDADPTQNAQTCLDKCKDLGYQISEPNAPVTIVDCAGTSGSSLTRYITKADVILIPFKPHVADLETVIGWFLSAKEPLQERVIFVPTHLARTKEQAEGLEQLRSILKEEGRGSLGPGVNDRPAVYGPVMNGRPENFFNSKLDEKIRDELNYLFTAVTSNFFQG